MAGFLVKALGGGTAAVLKQHRAKLLGTAGWIYPQSLPGRHLAEQPLHLSKENSWEDQLLCGGGELSVAPRAPLVPQLGVHPSADAGGGLGRAKGNGLV